MDSYTVERLNKVRRSDRANYDRASIHAVLDEGVVAHVGFVDEGRPFVIPMIYGRIGDTLYIHGAKAARFAKAMAPGLPVCITVTLVDGIVVARSAFHMSMNYRSAVLHGHAVLVTDAAEGESALVAITGHVLPGRWAEARPMTEKEFKATSVLRVTVEAASLKSRTGMPVDDDEDYGLPLWGGVVPLSTQVGAPQDDGAIPPATPIPDSIKALIARHTKT
jgi:nitroimidazol reductase NimA-like FMN-containing flavoprotein (pyridoxamine 5'-phosphate oxidase superfamily)